MSMSLFLARCSLLPGAWRRWRSNALYVAILHDHLPLARALLDKISPNLVFAARPVPIGKIAMPMHPLSMAMRRGNAEMLSLLLEKGADPNDGQYPFQGVMATWLIMATHSHAVDPLWCQMGRLLLAHGGDIDRGLAPEGSSSLYDVLEGTGRMERINHLRAEYEATLLAHTLDPACFEVVRQPAQLIRL